MIMTFTGRPSSSANAGPAKRTLAAAIKHLVVESAVAIILRPSMEGPPSGYRYLWLRRELPLDLKAFFMPRKYPASAVRGGSHFANAINASKSHFLVEDFRDPVARCGGSR
jgi:hypothetical protein